METDVEPVGMQQSRRDFHNDGRGCSGRRRRRRLTADRSNATGRDDDRGGRPLDINIGSLAAGQQIIIKWRGHPIVIVNRPPDALKTLQDPALVNLLLNANSQAKQPDYADNWHQSLKPGYAVLVAVCTHLGCIPIYEPNKDQLAPGWRGGWFCPCHGSKYDLAGRVFRSVPAPCNLPVPPYRF